MINKLEQRAIGTDTSVFCALNQFKSFNSLAIKNHKGGIFQVNIGFELTEFEKSDALVLQETHFQEGHSQSESHDGSIVVLLPSHFENNVIHGVSFSSLFILGIVKVLVDGVLTALNALYFVGGDHVYQRLDRHVFKHLLETRVYLRLLID
jgi:hypothetical protein